MRLATRKDIHVEQTADSMCVVIYHWEDGVLTKAHYYRSGKQRGAIHMNRRLHRGLAMMSASLKRNWLV